MTPENANRRIIKFLRDLADDGSVQITQNRHPLVSATTGQKRSFGLSCSPNSNFQQTMRCLLVFDDPLDHRARHPQRPGDSPVTLPF